MPNRRPDASSRGVLVVLGLLSVLGPLGTDAFLPALPAIADAFDSSASTVQLCLTAFTCGMALGQIIVGTLSDGVGRRKPLLLASAGMAAGAALAATSGSVGVLVASCAVTGLGASGGAVLGRAIVSDTSTGRSAVRRFSVLGALTTIGPVVGPLLGAVALATWDWRAVFWVLCGLAAAGTVAVAVAVPESLPPERRTSGGVSALPSRAREVLGDVLFRRSASLIWTGFALTFAYISASPFVVQSVLGMSPAAFAVVFAVNGTGLIGTGVLTAWLSQRHTPVAVMSWGVALQVVAATLLTASTVFDWHTAYTLLPAMFCIASALGFIFGPATGLAVRNLRHVAGTALALLGSVQFMVAGIAAPVVGLGGEDSITAFAVIAGLLSVGSVAALLQLSRASVTTAPGDASYRRQRLLRASQRP